MKKQVLFIQGGGEDGYQADKVIVELLQEALKENYEVLYPQIPSDDQAPDFGWPGHIGKEIAALKDGFVLVAHSLGASMLLKYLSENDFSIKAAGIFLLAAPFWSGQEEWKKGLKLHNDFAANLPKDVRFFFYHCKDDEEVPFGHLSKYQQKIPAATFQEIETGGHQFGGSINLVIIDIKDLYT